MTARTRSAGARLHVVPMTLREANAFVLAYHRHHDPVRGCLFCLGASDGARIVGVAIVGRPVSRVLQAMDYTAEVTRLCVDDAFLSEVSIGVGAGAWFAARERGLRGLAHAGHVLGAVDRCPYRHAPSLLYSAAWRACRAMGYARLVTYTLPEEGGLSLRAAGWRCVGEAGGGSWHRDARPRVDTAPTQTKLRWEACA